VELYESVAAYLKEVGMNVKVNVIDPTLNP
jgi:hypothetical protein